MTTLPTNRPNAYSYVRWSSPDQAKGNTLDRQLERAQAYADEHSLNLIESERWEDAGMPAYRGRNWHEGALRAFVTAVDEDRVPRGSYLLVERLDRLSRDHVLPALNRMQEITGRGITIVTLNDGQEWTKDSFKDLGPLYYSIAQLSTANIESQNKQARSLDNWQRKRKRAVEDGTALTRTCPLWLEVGDDGKYRVIPDRVKVVKLIFELALEGLGARRIARKLNEMEVPKFTDPSRPRDADSRGWSGSYVHGILTNDATIGVWRGHRVVPPGEDGESFARRHEQDAENGIVDDGSVYPAVVDRDVWLRAQELVRIRKNGTGGGRPKKPVGQAVTSMSNLFTGMCHCSCGAGLRFHRASMTKRPKLVCSSHLQGASSGCVARRWDYKSVETFLLYALAEGDVLDFTKLFPDSYHDELQATLEALEADQGKLSADLQVANERAERIVDAIERGTDTARMHDRLKGIEQEIEELKQRLPEIEREIERQRAVPRNTERTLTDAREALQEFIAATWRQSYAPGEAFGFHGAEEGYTDPTPTLTPDETRDLREKLHRLLRGVIEGITFEARRDGSGVVTLASIPQGQLVMRLEDKLERVATIEEPQDAVPPMELEDVPLEAGKGLGRGRLTKALLRVHLDGELEGDPEAVQEYAV